MWYKNLLRNCLVMGSFFMSANAANAQAATAKEVNQQFQTWFSLNSTWHLTDRWGVIGDFHVRRNNGVKDPSFYFARVAANYWLKERLTLAAGYAHMWNAPAVEGWSEFSDEHRIYQQALLSTKVDKTDLVLRLRNEQRWKEVMANDDPTGDWTFTNRVRMLFSFNFPLSRNNPNWSLVAADEILFNMGSSIVYNTFDQNRVFLGVRQKLSKTWSYDIGYMNVYQQKSAGYKYDMNHTFRWFFYYSPDFRKSKHPPKQVLDTREE